MISLIKFATFICFLLIENEAIDSSVKEVLLKLHNEKRNQAGIELLSWDNSLANTASESMKKFCYDQNAQGFGNNIYLKMPNPNQRAASQITEISINAVVFKEIFTSFNYSTDKIAGCFESKTMTQSEKLSITFIGNLMNEKTKNFGCEFQSSCSDKKRNEFDLLLCLYRPKEGEQPDFSLPPFSKNNFIQLCKSEPNQWSSCEANLNEECKANFSSLKKQSRRKKFEKRNHGGRVKSPMITSVLVCSVLMRLLVG